MSDTPRTDSMRGFHDLDTAVNAEFCEQLERELTAAQAELKNSKELHDRLLNEYAHVDTEVRKLALAAGIPQDVIDGDSYSVPGIEELVELIVQKFTAAQAEIARLRAGGCARVKRLEAAGGALADSFPRTHPQHDELMNQWNKAKEAKP